MANGVKQYKAVTTLQGVCLSTLFVSLNFGHFDIEQYSLNE